jgi:isocitrate dehydrogenase (NAD+)
MLLSAVMLLRHLGESRAADRVERAVHTALGDPTRRTADLGGPADLDRFTETVIGRLE